MVQPTSTKLTCITDTFTYVVLLVGIIRAGYQAFPISLRNSSAGVANLLQKTRSKFLFISGDAGAQRLATTACTQPSIGGQVGDHIMRLAMPTFDSLFDRDEDFDWLPPVDHPDETDPALILHSSGMCSHHIRSFLSNVARRFHCLP